MYTVIVVLTAGAHSRPIKRCVDRLAGVSGRAGGPTAQSCGQRGCIGAFARFARFVSLAASEAARRLMEPISGATQQSGHTLPMLLSPIPQLSPSASSSTFPARSNSN